MSAAGFVPPAWLRNHHLQSILPTSRLRRPWVMGRVRPLLDASRDTVLDCGAGVRLSGFHARHESRLEPDSGRPLVVLLHGWEGSAQSLYVLSLGGHLFTRGCDIFRLNFRDHGGSHALNPGIFHSCRIDEVVGAVARLRASHAGPLLVGGFSLGGNFALRVAARAPGAGIDLDAAFAICPVLSPQHTMAELERGWFVYREYFIAKWKRSLKEKQRCFPDRYDLSDILRQKSLTAMTDCMVQRYSEFPDLDAYLTGYSIVQGALDGLKVRSHVLIAEDDPIIPARDAALLPRIPSLLLTQSRFGGHCGFLDHFGSESWVNNWVGAALRMP